MSTETHQPSPEIPESASPGDEVAEVATAAPEVLASSLGDYLRISFAGSAAARAARSRSSSAWSRS